MLYRRFVIETPNSRTTVPVNYFVRVIIEIKGGGSRDLVLLLHSGNVRKATSCSSRAPAGMLYVYSLVNKLSCNEFFNSKPVLLTSLQCTSFFT